MSFSMILSSILIEIDQPNARKKYATYFAVLEKSVTGILADVHEIKNHLTLFLMGFELKPVDYIEK